MGLTPRPAAPVRAAAQFALICTYVFACLLTAHADGGHVALHATSGAYTITLFTAPVPLEAGPCDLSLLVQDSVTGDVLPDATAAATLISPGGATVHLPLAGRQGRPLLSATPLLSQPGGYALSLQVTRPRVSPATFTTALAVAANHRRRSTLIAYLLFPVLAIGLFLANQQAKRKASLRLP